MVGAWPTETRKVDPMFNYEGLSHKDLIKAVLNDTKLQEDPGKNYVYSNFGYCLLGRIIEQITGKIFIDFIRETFNLDCHIAGNLYNETRKDENYYYS